MIKRIIFIGILILMPAILFYNTIKKKSKNEIISVVATPSLPKDALTHFQQAIRINTISFANPKEWDSIPFIAFRKFIENSYPLVHKQLKREIISKYSLLYTWEGTDKNLNPYILMAHQDVVPVEASTEKLWMEKPFDGIVKDGYIWGRGTTDDKINLIGILEAAEKLLQQNYKPKRTIYFVFGHDEEIGGEQGALQIAKLLEDRNVLADLVLDEGGFITDKVPGIKKSVALIGTAEKGYMTLEMTVNKTGGHSSMPEKETAIDILMNALLKLHKHPFEARLNGQTAEFMDFLSPEMGFPNNMAFANPWLFKKLIVNKFEQQAATNAMIRTTSVTTILESGIKDNVVPTIAKATVNFRLLPGDSGNIILKKVFAIINDTNVKISIRNNLINEASASANINDKGFKLVEHLVKSTFKNTVTSSFLLIGGTDSKHFENISKNIIKFSPMKDPIGFHGINERVSIKSFEKNIWFFEQLLEKN